MPYEIIDIPLNSGLNTKADSRALPPPGLSVASDVQFDEVGGLQTRPQFLAITDAAGNTIADIRRVTAYGDELVAFSKDKVWSYSGGDGLWTERAEYLAVDTNEESRFVTTGDQYDADRAEFSGLTFFTWTEDTPSGTVAYVAAVDSATGAIKLSPTAVKSGATRCRLIAAESRIFLTYVVSVTLWIRAYQADLSSSETSRSVSSFVSYDAIQDPEVPESIIIAIARTANYTVARYDENPSQSLAVTFARSSTGPISIAYDLDTGGVLCVSRYGSSTEILGDIMSDSFVDVSAGNIIRAAGTAVDQLSSSYDSVALCHVIWSAGETSGSGSFALGTNTISNAGAVGTKSNVVLRCGLASRAFTHDGNVYAWAAFAAVSQGALTAQLQNSYFLFRVDGLVVAKAVAMQAGGFAATSGSLPGVQDLGFGAFAWCGLQRRIIPLGQQQRGYAAKSLQDIEFSFDSNEARRTAQLGETLYISGGQLSQFDGRSITEVGFSTFPWELSIIPTAGSNLNGTYNWKQTYSWFNAKGEFERSTSATIFDQAITTNQASMVGVNLHVTAKKSANGEVAGEFWRQVADAAVGAPFYLVTSKDPSATLDNRYVENDTTAGTMATFIDDLSDGDLISREDFPENAGGTLANLAPPSASIVIATQDRLLLAGIPGSPNRLVYSRTRDDGEIASFNDYLFLDLPAVGGRITALALLGETLIVFKESAIYSIPGDGFDNAGGGQNYGPARILPSDVGAVSQEAVALTSKGILFKSSKGFYLLGYGGQVQYVGAAVADFDPDSVVSMHVIESQHQVRIVTDARTIVWDYLLAGMQQDPLVVGQWATWAIYGVDSVVWSNTHHVVNATADSLLAQSSSHSGAGDLPQLDITMGWIKTDGLQGYGLVRRMLILGEYLGAHDLRVRAAYNYDDTWIDDKTWTVSPTTIGGPLQLEHGLSRPKCESVKFRITAQAVGAATAPTTKALNLTGMSLEVKRKNNHFGKGMGAAQKQ